MRAVSAAYLRQWRPPPGCEEGFTGSPEQQRLRRLFPGVLLTKSARSDLREHAASILDEQNAPPADRLEAILSLEWCCWSKAVTEHRIRRPFHGWLRDHLQAGQAYQISGDAEVEWALWQAFELRATLKAPVKSARKKNEIAATA